MKIEIFPLSTGYSCTTLWVKNSLELLYLLPFPRYVLCSAKIQDGRQKWRKLKFFPRHRILIFSVFHFLLKSKMAAKSGENWNFSPFIGYSCTTLWIKNSLEVDLSLYHFRDIHNFSFSAKSQDDRQKLKSFPLGTGYTCTTL